MPYELRQTIRLTLRMDDLDVGEIAGADATIKLMIADMKTVAADHGFTVETDKAKLVGVRAKGETEPQGEIGSGGAPGALANDLLSKSAPPADPHAGMEIPEHLRRSK